MKEYLKCTTKAKSIIITWSSKGITKTPPTLSKSHKDSRCDSGTDAPQYTRSYLQLYIGWSINPLPLE